MCPRGNREKVCWSKIKKHKKKRTIPQSDTLLKAGRCQIVNQKVSVPSLRTLGLTCSAPHGWSPCMLRVSNKPTAAEQGRDGAVHSCRGRKTPPPSPQHCSWETAELHHNALLLSILHTPSSRAALFHRKSAFQAL